MDTAVPIGAMIMPIMVATLTNQIRQLSRSVGSVKCKPGNKDFNREETLILLPLGLLPAIIKVKQ
jgi:hypothetical protein